MSTRHIAFASLVALMTATAAVAQEATPWSAPAPDTRLTRAQVLAQVRTGEPVLHEEACVFPAEKAGTFSREQVRAEALAATKDGSLKSVARGYIGG